MITVLQTVCDIFHSCDLPAKEELNNLSAEAACVLQNYPQSLRPAVTGCEDIPGGLLDFTSQRELPLIIVPDLHARIDFLPGMLETSIGIGNESGTVAELLNSGKIRVVCVGDILHSEGAHKQRWQSAFQDFIAGNPCSPQMCLEMAEGLGTLMQVMHLLCAYPDNFFCIKGNHENIKNEQGFGNYPFRKFAAEGEMTLEFMASRYGLKTVEEVSRYEKLLPLVVFDHNAVVSHSEPKTAFSRQEIIDSPLDSNVVEALTWTGNAEAEEGCVEKMLKEVRPGAFYFGGHRSVEGNYNIRQNGLYIQIHNPERKNIVLVRPDCKFDPDKHIISIGNFDT